MGHDGTQAIKRRPRSDHGPHDPFREIVPGADTIHGECYSIKDPKDPYEHKEHSPGIPTGKDTD